MSKTFRQGQCLLWNDKFPWLKQYLRYLPPYPLLLLLFLDDSSVAWTFVIWQNMRLAVFARLVGLVKWHAAVKHVCRVLPHIARNEKSVIFHWVRAEWLSIEPVPTMSLGEQSQKWFPTHVQATVLQASSLQPKGKNGTNDAYTIIQLGKEKYSTSVAEKTLNPLWREEASFELPGLLLEGNPEVYELCLIVMHRSLVGMDKFLGQRSINLNEIFDNKERKKIE